MRQTAFMIALKEHTISQHTGLKMQAIRNLRSLWSWLSSCSYSPSSRYLHFEHTTLVYYWI